MSENFAITTCGCKLDLINSFISSKSGLHKRPAFGTRNPDGGYPADSRDVADGIGKLRKL